MQAYPEIRLGIAGTGVMGAYHTRTAASLPGCRLTGVYDADVACMERVARQFGTTAYRSLAELCGEVEAVIVATPANTHALVAAECLHAGKHVLLEKPIATTTEEAEELIDVSLSKARVLMIGHIERFNPAFIALQALLPAHELFACELQRLCSTPGRDQSVDIILDLMIHDLDLLLALAGTPATTLASAGQSNRGLFIDHVTALLRLPHGISATLTASAVSHERVRCGRFYTQDCQFGVDFANRQLTVYRYGKSGYPRADGELYSAYHAEQMLVPNKEPLALEQEHFCHAIRTDTSLASAAEDALAALKLALAIQTEVNEQLLMHA